MDVGRRQAWVVSGLAAGTFLLSACSSTTAVSTSTSGVVDVSVTSSGESRDTAFSVTFDADSLSYQLLADSTLSFTTSVGTHSVKLSDIAGNCAVDGDNPRTVSVTDGSEQTIAFAVSCTLDGQAKVTIATTGQDLDDMYTLDFNSGEKTVLVGPNQFVLLTLPAKPYSVALTGVASNCSVTGDNPIALDVSPDSMATGFFAVACVAK